MLKFKKFINKSLNNKPLSNSNHNLCLDQALENRPNENGSYNFIIALAGPYGSGCSSFGESLYKTLKDYKGVNAKIIKASQVIESFYPELPIESLEKLLSAHPKLRIDNTPKTSDNAKTTNLHTRERRQKQGTTIRLLEPELIGKLIASQIHLCGKDFDNDQASHGHCNFFIIDSLKNDNDYRALKDIYKDELFLCFIYASPETRFKRMVQYKGWENLQKSDFDEVDAIDSDEKLLKPETKNAGQAVTKLSTLSDYYIVNDDNNLNELRSNGKRFIDLLLGFGINQPTFHEKSMHLAYSASNRSGCLSRQVGAAIVDKDGAIIGIGHNDVPQAGGGLYEYDSTADKRCYIIGDKKCSNQSEITYRENELTQEIIKHCPGGTELTAIQDTVSKSKFKQVTEYCRAVHAEMEALLSVSRSTGQSSQGKYMYVTTFPCHNCIKHIICAGIDRVYYIEPYPKSLAVKLHGDALAANPVFTGNEQKVHLLPYEGVAPRRFHDFFAQLSERKLSDGTYTDHLVSDCVSNPRFSFKIQRRNRNDLSQASFGEYSNNEYLISKYQIGGHRNGKHS